MLTTLTCIEIGVSTWNIWQIDQKGYIDAKSLPVSANTLDNSNAMAQLLNERIGKKILFLLNTSHTIIKLSEESLPSQYLSYEKAGYILSHSNFLNKNANKRIWTSATPKFIPNNLVEMCRSKKIRIGRIKAIDTLDYRITHYLSKLYDSVIWIFIPQEPGIRLIVLQDGIPINVYVFSNNLDFRYNELVRIWICQAFSPQHAIVLSDNTDYDWIKLFLKERSLEYLDKSSMDLKQDMVKEWVANEL